MNRRRFALALFLLFLLILPVFAAEEARSVNAACDMRIYGEQADTLLDGNLRSHSKVHYGTEVTIRSSELIGGLYLQFSVHPGEWTILCGERTIPCGGEGFLHEYVPDLNAYSLTLLFRGEGILANVYALSPGEKPHWVQDWQRSWDKADVLLLPAHSDDDTLFFGGLVPWCLDRGARVQVAYLVSHLDEPFRRNELLNGLWESGLRNYPVLGEYEDKGPDEELSRQLEFYAEDGVSYEDMLLRTARLYRRFKPQVVICHDEEGEYGHGAHRLCYKLATEALELSGDSSVDGDSVARNGVWIPDKLYVHLQKERGITIDLDEPLRSFAYKTGYELAQRAFEQHESQYDYFAWYFWGAPTASKLAQYSSREYGLYYSSVGDDTTFKSFFDNLTLYDALSPSVGEPEEPEPEAERAKPEPEQAEESAAAPSAVAVVDPRLAEIRAEQKKLIIGISALAVLVAVLLVILAKLQSKERGKNT